MKRDVIDVQLARERASIYCKSRGLTKGTEKVITSYLLRGYELDEMWKVGASKKEKANMLDMFYRLGSKK